jgi:hypothetical protein
MSEAIDSLPMFWDRSLFDQPFFPTNPFDLALRLFARIRGKQPAEAA